MLIFIFVLIYAREVKKAAKWWEKSPFADTAQKISDQVDKVQERQEEEVR